jgi:cellulose biosynthesis protein BcsQ
MQTIGVFNTKGGSGKSAVTVFLADFLSTSFKKRVLVIDLDPQQSSAIALLGEERLLAASHHSLPDLMKKTVRGAPSVETAESYLIERPAIEGRGKHKFLRSLHVLACDREAWHDLNDDLYSRPKSRRRLH